MLDGVGRGRLKPELVGISWLGLGGSPGCLGLGLAGAGAALKPAETISGNSLAAGQKIGKAALDTALGVGVLKSAQIGKAVGAGIRKVGLTGLTKYQHAGSIEIL